MEAGFEHVLFTTIRLILVRKTFSSILYYFCFSDIVILQNGKFFTDSQKSKVKGRTLRVKAKISLNRVFPNSNSRIVKEKN
jgi:hypothetical protein